MSIVMIEDWREAPDELMKANPDDSFCQVAVACDKTRIGYTLVGDYDSVSWKLVCVLNPGSAYPTKYACEDCACWVEEVAGVGIGGAS